MCERWLLRAALFTALSLTNTLQANGQSLEGQQTILFGAAYYEEYAPSDRLVEDVRMRGVAVIEEGVR